MQVVQVAGALLILCGFLGAQAHRLATDDLRYLTVNLVGSGTLAVVAIDSAAWGFVLLEGVWAAVSAAGLAARLRGRPAAGPAGGGR